VSLKGKAPQAFTMPCSGAAQQSYTSFTLDIFKQSLLFKCFYIIEYSKQAATTA
jgi:hypothetical protein